MSENPKVVPFSTDAMFQIPKFEMPSMEVHPAFREFAEKGVAQAKDGYDKMKANAEKATETLESTVSIASKGLTDYNYKLIETARANSNAAYDLFGELLGAKSYAEFHDELKTVARRKLRGEGGDLRGGERHRSSFWISIMRYLTPSNTRRPSDRREGARLILPISSAATNRSSAGKIPIKQRRSPPMRA